MVVQERTHYCDHVEHFNAENSCRDSNLTYVVEPFPDVEPSHDVLRSNDYFCSAALGGRR